MPSSLVNTGVQFPDNTIQTTAAVATPSVIPAGTVMLFVQTAAPTGFTKSTTHDNKALRIVSGTASTGGTVAFTTAFSSTRAVTVSTISGSAGNTTLSTPQIPSHTHRSARFIAAPYSGGLAYPREANQPEVGGPESTATGGGGAHSHPFSFSSGSGTVDLAVQYVDVIIAVKD
jgi:hypothetical protein